MQLILLFICRHSGCGTILFFNECTNTCTHTLLNWVCTNCVYVCMLRVCVCARCRRLSFVAFAFPFPIFFGWLFFSSVPCLLAVAALCLLSFLNAFTARLFIFPLLQIHQVYSTHSPDDKSICVPRWLSGKLYCINCAKAVTPLNLIDLYKCLCALDRFYIKTHL